MLNSHSMQHSFSLGSDWVLLDHDTTTIPCNQPSNSASSYVDQEDERLIEHDVSAITTLSPGLALQSTPIRGQPHVYLLPTLDRTRLKIGRSIDPLERIAELTRVYPEIDLSRAVLLAVDAKIVETILHDVFEPYRLVLSKRRDGSTEWFVGDFAEEVVDFCLRIAYHRKARYAVIRDLPALLRGHFSQRQAASPSTTAPVKRPSRSSCQPAGLAELATYQAREFVKMLQERQFDEVVIQNDAYFLVRTVQRNDEPECWKPSPWPQASEWGLKLLRSATIHGRVDGGPFFAQLIQIPSFRRQDSEKGLEYYRIERGPAGVVHPAANAQAVALAPAFALLWDALAHLPQRAVPLPPSIPQQHGFQRRPSRLGATPAALATTQALELGRA